MQRYNTIRKYSDTWGFYEEKGKVPQWVNLKSGQRYDYRNKETLPQFLKRLEETNNMTFKTISDKAKEFTFTYDFSDYKTSLVGSSAIIGYMLGTYATPAIDTASKSNGQLTIKYIEDNRLDEVFKRICDGVNNPYDHCQGN